MTTISDEQLDEWKKLVAELRQFWSEITEDDGGESGQMAMERRAADAIEQSIAEVERLREALTKAAEQFELYASEHRRKAQIALGNGLEAASQSSTEKALANERFADMCRASQPEKQK